MTISKSVMKLMEDDNSVTFRVACACKDNKCDLTIDLEVEKDCPISYLNFYKTLSIASYWNTKNWFKEKWLRIKYALGMLFTGRIEVEESFVMSSDNIDGFIEALGEVKKKMEEIEKF